MDRRPFQNVAKTGYYVSIGARRIVQEARVLKMLLYTFHVTKAMVRLQEYPLTPEYECNQKKKLGPQNRIAAAFWNGYLVNNGSTLLQIAKITDLFPH